MITENLKLHIAKDNNPLSLLKKYCFFFNICVKYYAFEFPIMQIVPTTEVEKGSIVSSLKIKNKK
jgi:hypothetical protein